MEQAINNFIAILRKYKSDSEYVRYYDALGKAIALSEQAITEQRNGNKISHTLESIGRMVSDSLPWPDDLLRAWRKVEKESK
jgi:hypothetical protein